MTWILTIMFYSRRQKLISASGLDLLKSIPKEKGVYVLLIRVKKDIDIKTRGKLFYLRKGIYAYVGSAHGSGGLKARLMRHMKISKNLFWHIDYLLSSNYAELINICFYVVEEDLESYIAHRLIERCSPVIGFGSSDKRKDLSHLFHCGNDFTNVIPSVKDLLPQLKCLDLSKSS